MTKENITYWNYLELEQLLALQNGIDDENVSEDELHFIIVHQVFELWFKLMIRELRLVRDAMAKQFVKEETIPFVVHHLKRVNTILQLSAKHFDLMETLTPQDFLEFRAKLGTASGFQSFQLREIEFILGLDQEQRNAQGHGDPAAYIMNTAESTGFGAEIRDRINKARNEKSLRDSIHNWLYRTPIHGSRQTDADDKEVVAGFVDDYIAKMHQVNELQIDKLVADGGNEEQLRQQFAKTEEQAASFLHAKDIKDNRERVARIRAAILFIESYRKLPLLAWPRLLIDTIVEMEEHMTDFRFQHARMVERIIGRRVGTGGSAGVNYLDETTQYRIFPELWAVRTLLLPRDYLPELQNKELYHFATEFQE